MATTKLALWNEAMVALGHRRFTDTGEPVEAARELTAVHDHVVAECLSSGSWNFAMETIKATSDTGVTPEFGYTEVFAKPSDWVRTIALSQDERFATPLLHYVDDANFWSADVSPVYVRYVSDDTGLGMDLTRWTPKFTRFVELELADRVCLKVTQSSSLKEQIGVDRDKARKAALNQDAMNQAQPAFPPPSGWTVARGGSRRGDRGRRGSFTG